MAANTFAYQSHSFRDCKGVVARVRYVIHYDSGEATADAAVIGNNMRVALLAASNAADNGSSGPYSDIVPATYGTRADYADCEDKAVLVFQAVDGSLHRMSVPAPKAALFMADAMTVSPTSTLLPAIIAALTSSTNSAQITTRGGSPFAVPTFVGGQRQRRRTSRKLTIWTLSGGLDEPAE